VAGAAAEVENDVARLQPQPGDRSTAEIHQVRRRMVARRLAAVLLAKDSMRIRHALRGPRARRVQRIRP
jgi:hypothetical protein